MISLETTKSFVIGLVVTISVEGFSAFVFSSFGIFTASGDEASVLYGGGPTNHGAFNWETTLGVDGFSGRGRVDDHLQIKPKNISCC